MTFKTALSTDRRSNHSW